jgi:hypothetical protein
MDVRFTDSAANSVTLCRSARSRFGLGDALGEEACG